MLKRIFIILLIVAFNYQSQARILYSYFNNWAIFKDVKKNNKICYVLGKPDIAEHNKRNSYFMVTNFGNGLEQISLSTSYFPVKKSIIIEFPSGKSFEVLTNGRSSWGLTEEDDLEIIKLMTQEEYLRVVGKNAKNESFIDRYSLKSFNQAIKLMRSKCK